MGKTIQINQKSRPETKRLGRFFVSTGMFYHHAENIAETLASIRFLPVRVEHRADMDAFEMAGISESFDPITQGSVVPMYEIRIRTRADDGKEYAEVVRKTND